MTEIETLAARADPVPEEVVEAARGAFKAGRKKKPVGPRGSSERGSSEHGSSERDAK